MNLPQEPDADRCVTESPDYSRRWPAPAKINLFLHVLAKRVDGYHDLQTIFQFLDYADYLRFEPRSDGLIKRTYDHGFEENSDLCLQAAKLLKPFVPKDVGINIHLEKNIPMGGGLGGGSSDAATVLIALNHLWGLGLKRSKLAELGLILGADVPVFVMGQSAWAEGVGEQLTPLKLEEKWFLVVNPNICVSTAKVFANKHLTPRPQMKKIRAFRETREIHFGDNHLEPIVRAEYPEVDDLFSWLESFGKPRMSGSGGSVFMPLLSHQAGLDILANRPVNINGFVAKGVNDHPLRRL